MSIKAKIVLLFGTAVLAATPALAQPMTIFDDDMPVFYGAYTSQAMSPRAGLLPTDARLVERPLAEVISARLGFGEGKVVLFHYRLENAPSKATVLNGVVDGGGISLKLSW